MQAEPPSLIPTLRKSRPVGSIDGQTDLFWLDWGGEDGIRSCVLETRESGRQPGGMLEEVLLALGFLGWTPQEGTGSRCRSGTHRRWVLWVRWCLPLVSPHRWGMSVPGKAPPTPGFHVMVGGPALAHSMLIPGTPDDMACPLGPLPGVCSRAGP